MNFKAEVKAIKLELSKLRAVSAKPSDSSRQNEKDRWDKYKSFANSTAILFIAPAIAFAGHWVQNSVTEREAEVSQRELDFKMMELSLKILQADANPDVVPLRNWAVKEINLLNPKNPIPTTAAKILEVKPLNLGESTPGPGGPNMLLTDQAKYPNFTRWISIEIPNAMRKPKVWDAFIKWGQFKNIYNARRAVLGWDDSPFLRISDLPDGENGLFDPERPHEIVLATDIVELFEATPDREDLKLFMESTILHLLTHWGDNLDGKIQPVEVGKMFEIEAYGKDIQRPKMPAKSQ